MATRTETHDVPQTTGPQWTQDEAIAYECARECINHLMAIYTALIARERGKADPDDIKIDAFKAMQMSLATERQELRLHDTEAIAYVNREYGARIRKHGARSSK